MILNSATSSSTPTDHSRPARSANPFLIWRMTSNANEAQCIVHVTPRGIEVQYVLNGSMLFSYRFDRVEEVLSWSNLKQLTLQKRGWQRA